MIQVWVVKAGWGFFVRLQGSSLSAPSWKRYVLNRPRPMALMWTGLSTASRGPNSSCSSDPLVGLSLFAGFHWQGLTKHGHWCMQQASALHGAMLPSVMLHCASEVT